MTTMRTSPRAMGLQLFPLLAAIFLFVGFAGAAHAQSNFEPERIKKYQVLLVVGRDASLTVTETITVHARGRAIRRGIFREIPTTYRGTHGRRISIGFDVIKVLRDGRPEPWHTRGRSNGKALYIGDADTLLTRGRDYTYTIVWRVRRALGFFEKHDELYWNAIGHGWRFPIVEAQVTVRLPKGVKAGKVNAWTGYRGGRAQNVTNSTDDNGNPVFTLTQPLRPRQGMTVFVSFPKGVVTAPRFSTRLWWFFLDSPGSLAAAVGLIVGCLYFLIAWILVGRDPARGTIIPRFHPPKGFTPAACRFVSEMDFDDKSFAAALVSMAVKGHIRIEQLEGKEYKLHRVSKDTAKLSRGEKAVSKKMFQFGRDSIHMKQENHKTFSSAVSALETSLTSDYESAYFLRNAKWHFAGFAIAVAAYVAVAFSLSMDTFWVVLVLGVMLYVGARLLITTVDYLRLGNQGKAALYGSFAVGGAAIIGIAYATNESTDLTLLTIVLLACLALIHSLFQIYIKAPTSDGRRVMDEIDGLKMYMSVAEKDRLNLLNPPKQTPELFERLLPFALALNVENKWAEQFASVLASASKNGADYTPAWYYGLHWNQFSANDFGSSIGAGLTGAISSASTAPGSSSGGGGGGFSGGGGGGGGGGGW